MARADVAELYSRLTTDEFAMLDEGIHSLDDIYTAVRDQYPALCDDAFLCRESCQGGHDQPEWKHVVRKALDALKRRGPSRVAHAGPKLWQFD